jgi:Tfp pilus assembly protein PilF
VFDKRWFLLGIFAAIVTLTSALFWREAVVRYEIGTTLLEFGTPELGAKWLRTVLELQPDHQGAHRALARYYEAQGDWQNALDYRRRIVPK